MDGTTDGSSQVDVATEEVRRGGKSDLSSSVK